MVAEREWERETPRVYLPPRGRVRLAVPYSRDPEWPEWLREMCGEGTQPESEVVDDPASATGLRLIWTVSRPHFRRALQGLARRFERIEVTTEQRCTQQFCTGSCQRARSGPEMCECICRGAYHGDGASAAWVNIVGDLLVSRPDVYRRRFDYLHRWRNEEWFTGDRFVARALPGPAVAAGVLSA